MDILTKNRFLFTLIPLSLFFIHCQKDKPHRVQKEVEIPKSAPMVMNSNSPHAENIKSIRSTQNSNLNWKTPEGWIEEKGTGMRIATLFFNEGNKNAECIIVVLDGNAGGVKKNVERWMGELELVTPSSDELESFIQGSQRISTQSGYDAVVIDFTTLLAGSLVSSKSIIVSILQSEKNSVFVKATGDKSLLVKNKDKFIQLTQSLKFKSE